MESPASPSALRSRPPRPNFHLFRPQVHGRRAICHMDCPQRLHWQAAPLLARGTYPRQRRGGTSRWPRWESQTSHGGQRVRERNGSNGQTLREIGRGETAGRMCAPACTGEKRMSGTFRRRGKRLLKRPYRTNTNHHLIVVPAKGEAREKKKKKDPRKSFPHSQTSGAPHEDWKGQASRARPLGPRSRSSSRWDGPQKELPGRMGSRRGQCFFVGHGKATRREWTK